MAERQDGNIPLEQINQQLVERRLPAAQFFSVWNQFAKEQSLFPLDVSADDLKKFDAEGTTVITLLSELHTRLTRREAERTKKVEVVFNILPAFKRYLLESLNTAPITKTLPVTEQQPPVQAHTEREPIPERADFETLVSRMEQLIASIQSPKIPPFEINSLKQGIERLRSLGLPQPGEEKGSQGERVSAFVGFGDQIDADRKVDTENVQLKHLWETFGRLVPFVGLEFIEAKPGSRFLPVEQQFIDREHTRGYSVPDTVIRIIRTGYRLAGEGKVYRPAQVILSKGQRP